MDEERTRGYTQNSPSLCDSYIAGEVSGYGNPCSLLGTTHGEICAEISLHGSNDNNIPLPKATLRCHTKPTLETVSRKPHHGSGVW